jgi:hypothetical protein
MDDNEIDVCALDLSGSEQGPVARSCKHDNEPLGYRQGCDYLD